MVSRKFWEGNKEYNNDQRRRTAWPHLVVVGQNCFRRRVGHVGRRTGVRRNGPSSHNKKIGHWVLVLATILPFAAPKKTDRTVIFGAYFQIIQFSAPVQINLDQSRRVQFLLFYNK